MFGNEPSGDFLADGFHYRSQRCAKPPDIFRAGLDCCLSWSRVGLCGFFRSKRCRYRIFWLLCFSCVYDLCNRSTTQRFSLVHREHANKFSLSWLDRSRFLRLLYIAALVSDRGRHTGCFAERYLLDSSPPQSHLPGSDSAPRTPGACLVPSCAF